MSETYPFKAECEDFAELEITSLRDNLLKFANDPDILALRAAAKGKILRTARKLVDPDAALEVVRGDLLPGEFAFTFDDGPAPGVTEKILAILDKHGALSNFFQIGENAEMHPDISRALVKSGHVVGSHSMNHYNLTKLSEDEAEHQIRAGNNAVATVTRCDTRFFRYPFGVKTPALRDFVARERLATFFWSIDPRDWEFEMRYGNDFKGLFTGITSSIKEAGSGIVLLHDTMQSTAIVLSDVLNFLKVNDFTLVQFISG